jgi:fused signal recognition particle receptor
MALKLFKKKKNKIDEPEYVELTEEKNIVQDEINEEELVPLESTGFFKRLKSGLSKTRKILTTDIDELFLSGGKIDDDLLEELEELLITSDIGVKTTMDLMESISKKSSKISNADQLKTVLKEDILSFIDTQPASTENFIAKPHVILVVGVNGVGKTTTIGKLASKFTAEGKKVLIAAGDTFRAAAAEQLTIWADRAGAKIVKHKENTDPAAVAYDSIESAMARDIDVVLVDTAGRLHTRVNLMEELKKIKRALSKKLPDAPHETLIVLDATTGQNAVSQAKLFHEEIGVTGIALTKLDGTAKGGVVISICDSLKIPLKYIGIGEQVNDLQDFDPIQFVDALF